ncbi:MAG: hypothetical protein KBC84_09050 [Proteobacteria bacterium]|nr:hypothetical protein [Pseudomonadota bacterium]
MECSSEYFFPIIRLLEEIDGKKVTESGHSHVVLIRKQVENVFINEYKSSAYMIQLAVQLVRGMPLSIRQSDRAEISELALYLM